MSPDTHREPSEAVAALKALSRIAAAATFYPDREDDYEEVKAALASQHTPSEEAKPSEVGAKLQNIATRVVLIDAGIAEEILAVALEAKPSEVVSVLRGLLEYEFTGAAPDTHDDEVRRNYAAHLLACMDGIEKNAALEAKPATDALWLATRCPACGEECFSLSAGEVFQSGYDCGKEAKPAAEVTDLRGSWQGDDFEEVLDMATGKAEVTDEAVREALETARTIDCATHHQADLLNAALAAIEARLSEIEQLRDADTRLLAAAEVTDEAVVHEPGCGRVSMSVEKWQAIEAALTRTGDLQAENERLRRDIAIRKEWHEKMLREIDARDEMFNDPAFVRVPREVLEEEASWAVSTLPVAHAPEFAKHLLRTYGTKGDGDAENE